MALLHSPPDDGEQMKVEPGASRDTSTGGGDSSSVEANNSTLAEIEQGLRTTYLY